MRKKNDEFNDGVNTWSLCPLGCDVKVNIIMTIVGYTSARR